MTRRGSRVVAVLVGTLILTGLAAIAVGADKTPPSHPTMRGVVKSASATALVVDPETPGKEMRFVLDEHTIVVGAKFARIAATDLHKGDPVTVSYAEANGHAIARRVWRRGASEASKAPAGKAKTATSD